MWDKPNSVHRVSSWLYTCNLSASYFQHRLVTSAANTTHPTGSISKPNHNGSYLHTQLRQARYLILEHKGPFLLHMMEFNYELNGVNKE